MSLRQVTIGSAAMASVGILRMLTQLFIIPALARYLSPADYGIVAIAMPFVLFGMMFADAGMSQSLIRTSSKNIAEWSTSFWLVVALGAGLSLIIVAVGFFISLFLKQPILFPIIGTLSVIIFFQAIATVPGSSLQQQHKFTTIAAIEISAMFLSLGGTYATALEGWGAWALVVQQVIYFTTRVILTLILSPFRPHLVFKIAEIRDHLIFGRDMLGSNFVMFARQCLNNTIMGKGLGPAAVGIYTMGTLFSDMPGRIVSGPIQQVVYPRITKLKDDPAAIRTVFLFLSRVIAIMAVPVIGMLAAAHHAVFVIMLSEKWQQSGHIFMILAPVAAIQTVTALRGSIAMAVGRTDLMVRQALEQAVIAIAALLVAVFFGIEAVAVSVTLVSILYAPRAMLQIFPLIDLPIKDFIAVCKTPFVTTAVAIAAYVIAQKTLGPSDWESFGIAFFLGLFALMSGFFLQFSSLRNEVGNVKADLEKSERIFDVHETALS